jgi:hypothetical protein
MIMPGSQVPENLSKAFCILLLGIPLLAGCADPKISRLTKDLAADANGSTEQLKSFYDTLKETNRQMYLSETKAQRLAKTDVDPASPGPSNPFDDGKIQHRIEAARDLETVSLQLSEVASSKNVQQASQAIGIIGERLQGLSQFAQVKIPGLNNLAALGSPITTLLKLTVHGGFAIYADKWICKNVSSIDTVFGINAKSISAQIDKDAGNTKLRASTLVGRWQEANQKISTMPLASADQSIVLNELDKATKWEQQVGANTPSPLFEKTRVDFHALCDYARMKSPPQTGGN